MDPFGESTLHFWQEVKIISGNHAGKQGNVNAVRNEGRNSRLEIQVDGENIYVDLDQIEKGNKIHLFDCKLLLPEDERAEWDARMDELRRWNEGDPEIVSL